ncbi:hypothetical protein DFH09DRAFT_1144604 [Mycena vulgaris]|nr:hypothetical protein DFH09DRAFT_1144604 [Mycena vulgaris]
MNGEALTQIEGLWFSNETLILRAENSIFRVTKSILAARSPVFQSMFEFPQPSSAGDEMMDGSPVVRLHDSATDVEPFLRAIFDSSYFMPPPAEIDFHAALGILRLSHKYDVDYLHKRALQHLETVYPIDVAKVPAQTSVNYENGVIALDLKAIPIFQEVGATWLLPYAFYSVGTYPHSKLISGGETWDQLPFETKQTCFMVQPSLVRGVTKIHRFLGARSTCTTAELCETIKWARLRKRVTHRDAESSHPLSQCPEESWQILKMNLCHVCFADARAEYKLAEAEIWDALPANCGLENWEVLKERRRIALA